MLLLRIFAPRCEAEEHCLGALQGAIVLMSRGRDRRLSTTGTDHCCGHGGKMEDYPNT